MINHERSYDFMKIEFALNNEIFLLPVDITVVHFWCFGIDVNGGHLAVLPEVSKSSLSVRSSLDG